VAQVNRKDKAVFGNLEKSEKTCDGMFCNGQNGVVSAKTTDDRKVEFVSFENGKQLALVKSAMGYPAYYPVHDVKIEKPLKAVLMDLDGTTVHSEHFWIWIIEETIASCSIGEWHTLAIRIFASHFTVALDGAQSTELENPQRAPNVKLYLGDGFECDYIPSNNGSEFQVDLNSISTSVIHTS
jgi:hypothetical protein